MKWYIPSWNGDLRLEPDPDNDQRTLLTIHKPTADEERILALIGVEALKQKWAEAWPETGKPGIFRRKVKVVLDATLETVGPVVSKIMKPGPAVLSCITFKDGKVLTCSGTLQELQAISQEAAAAPPENPPVAAATVKRPTPSCPDCIPGSVEPASEVLLAFLNAEEHDRWSKLRQIVVIGGLSGHRYLLAHRHTPRAIAQTRICYDLDDKYVLKFHDWSVPPEEEVLASKLILEEREPWLRNEATFFGKTDIAFKNPFGGFGDGTWDTRMMERIGQKLQSLLS
jgi:hypothetical protein